MPKKTYSLSIRLVAKDATYISESNGKEPINVEGSKEVSAILEEKCTEKLSADPLVLVRPPKPTPPTWVPFVELMAPKAKLAKLKTSSAGAVLVVDNIGDDNRVMILSFGQGYHCIPAEIIEPYFGIKVAANSIDSDKIRSMTTSIPSSEGTKATVQTGVPTQPEQLALSLDSSILKGITGKVSKKVLEEQAENLQYLKGSITGSSSLTLKTSITSFDKLKELCLEAYKQSLKDDYKEKGFEWIDRLQSLKKHEVESAGLNEKLCDALNTRMGGGKTPEELYLSPPEIVDYERVDHYKFTGKLKSDITFADLEIKTLFELNKSSVDFSIDSLTASYVQSYDGSGTPASKWSIYKCLTFEITDDDKNNDENSAETYKYILTEGSWYRVDGKYYGNIKDDLCKAVERGKSLQIKLPQIKKDKEKKGTDELSLEDEGNYNERVAEDSPELICLDKKLLDLPDGNKFEVCDLLSRNQELIHVKKCCLSSHLSHLFVQGLNSVEILKSEPGTIEQLQEKIDETTNKGDASDFKTIVSNNKLSTDAKVIFALIDSREKENRGALPFFSLVTFAYARKRLQTMSVEVSVLWVTEEGTK